MSNNVCVIPSSKNRIYEKPIYEIFPFLKLDNMEYIDRIFFSKISKNVYDFVGIKAYNLPDLVYSAIFESSQSIYVDNGLIIPAVFEKAPDFSGNRGVFFERDIQSLLKANDMFLLDAERHFQKVRGYGNILYGINGELYKYYKE